MNEQEPMTSTPRTRKLRLAGAAGLLAAGAVTGGILASTLGASAATSSSTPSPSTSSQTATPGGTQSHDGAQSQSSTPVRGDEKAVSDSTSATLKAKALAAVPGGTVYRIETDAGDGAYEAHMTKSDGSLVTVKFDQKLNVTGVETGMGTGDPQLGGPHPNDSQNGSSSGSTAPTA